MVVKSGKVYAVANQDDRDLGLNAGETVRLTGAIDGTTITVSKMTRPPNKAANKK